MIAIAAMAGNRIIGNKGYVPWKIPNELKWFSRFTWGRTLIMGRVTFELLPPLPHRDIVVLSNSIPSLVEYHAKYKNKCRHLNLRSRQTFDVQDFPDAIVAGGAQIYQWLLPLCNELYMSYVMDDYEGDTYMPDFEHLFPNSERIYEYKDFWIVRHWR